MDTKTVVTTIQLIIAPVVMISACALLNNGLLTRYGTVNNRLRALTKERLDLTLNKHQIQLLSMDYLVERIQQIDRQLPDLLDRHHKIHRALTAVYMSIMFYVLTMFVIAFSALSTFNWSADITLTSFMISTGILFVGITTAVLEIRESKDALTYEVIRVLEIASPVSINAEKAKGAHQEDIDAQQAMQQVQQEAERQL